MVASPDSKDTNHSYHNLSFYTTTWEDELQPNSRACWPTGTSWVPIQEKIFGDDRQEQDRSKPRQGSQTTAAHPGELNKGTIYLMGLFHWILPSPILGSVTLFTVLVKVGVPSFTYFTIRPGLFILTKAPPTKVLSLNHLVLVTLHLIVLTSSPVLLAYRLVIKHLHFCPFQVPLPHNRSQNNTNCTWK